MKVLAAVDGSGAARDAVRHALHLWREGLKVTLVLATAQAPTYLYEMVLPPDSDVLEKGSGAVCGRALEGAEALCVEAGMPFEREIGQGEPSPILIEIAERYNCEAIILGARGLGDLVMLIGDSLLPPPNAAQPTKPPWRAWPAWDEADPGRPASEREVAGECET